MKTNSIPALLPLVGILMIGCKPPAEETTGNPGNAPASAGGTTSGIAGTPTSYQDSVSQAGNKCYEITGVLDYDKSRDFPLAQLRLNYVRKSDPREHIGDQTIFIGGVYIRDINSVKDLPTKVTVGGGVMNSAVGIVLPLTTAGGISGTMFYDLPGGIASDNTEKLDPDSASGALALDRYTTDLGNGNKVFVGQGMMVVYLRTVNVKDKTKNVQLSNAIAFPVDFDESPPRITQLD